MNCSCLVVGIAQVPSQVVWQEEEVKISSDVIAGILSFAFLLIIISIYIALVSCWVWLSLISGLVLCFAWVVSSRIVRCHFACKESFLSRILLSGIQLFE